MKYRYYSTQRPVMPGSYPKNRYVKVLEIHNFDQKVCVQEIGQEAWGYIEYDKPLDYFAVVDYELVAVKTKTLHLRYKGIDSWGRYVYEDENGNLWKNVNCCTPKEICEKRGDTLNSSAGNEFDGEPDCHMGTHIQVVYLPDEAVQDE